MKNIRNAAVVSAVAIALLGADVSLAQGRYGYGQETAAPRDKFYLSFSIGDGTYFNYRCDYGDGCDTVIVAPIEFEVLFGYRLSKFFYLDLAVNWAVDYYQGYYEKVTYLAGFRPGIRVVFPLLFHRSLYLRGAVPIEYTIDDHNLWVVGLLLGVGIEWRFQNVGFFLEADIMPYFTEIYPDYYVIPVQGRAGVSIRF
jgi:hypothetical protein